MDSYRRYQQARDTAWRALLQLREKSLPVDAEGLARDVGMACLPFPGAEEEPRLYSLLKKAGAGKAVSLRIRGKWHIFLREKGMTDAERRFAVAHELGHLLLGHETWALAPGVRAFTGQENEGDVLEDPEDISDDAADIFAIRLLAPACLLHEMHIDTAGGIQRLCGLPPRAAAVRAQRMELLNQRDAYFTHPLERQVRDQFLPFLRSCAALTQETRPVQTIKTPDAPPPAAPSGPDREEAPKGKKCALPWAVALPAAGLLFLLAWLIFRF